MSRNATLITVAVILAIIVLIIIIMQNVNVTG